MVRSPIPAFISLNHYFTNALFYFCQFFCTARLSFYGGGFPSWYIQGQALLTSYQVYCLVQL